MCIGPDNHLSEFIGTVKDYDESVRIDSRGKLQLSRMLPFESPPIPEELVPNSILALLSSHKAGLLSKLPRNRYHTAVSRLRRYRLISCPTKRIDRSLMNPEELKIYHRDYVRKWRAQFNWDQSRYWIFFSLWWGFSWGVRDGILDVRDKIADPWHELEVNFAYWHLTFGVRVCVIDLHCSCDSFYLLLYVIYLYYFDKKRE